MSFIIFLEQLFTPIKKQVNQYTLFCSYWSSDSSSQSAMLSRCLQKVEKLLTILSTCQGLGTASNSLVLHEPCSMSSPSDWFDDNPASRPKAHSHARLCSCRIKECCSISNLHTYYNASSLAYILVLVQYAQ